jgi:outer membrane protein assembly factor BamB
MAKRMKGFGVSAFAVGDTIYLSGADGIVHSLEAGAEAWTTGLARLETPRFFHRLLPHGDHLLFVGGAGRGGHLGSVETLAIDSLVPGSVSPEPEEQKAEDKPDAADVQAAWPGFRGRGDGHTAVKVPLRWSTEEGVAWRAELPGFGQSAPVVWGQQVVASSVEGPDKETLLLSAFDLETGAVRWRRRFAAGQTIESSDMVSRGAPTPAVDSRRIYAFWESGDLVALDHEGETLWHRALAEEYGAPQGNHGLASSPVLAGDLVIVQVTHEGPSYFLAVDAASGENRWKVDRPSKVAWTTPVVVEGKGRLQLVSSAAGRVEALDARTGETLWTYGPIEKNHVPSVVVAGDLVLAPSSEPGQSLALRRAPEPNRTERVAWRTEGVSSGFGSPLVQGGCALFVNKAGALTCLDLETGVERWQHRLPGATWASPIAAGENAFFFTKEGPTAVLHPTVEGPGEVVENPLTVDGTVYGVAAAPGAFLLRTGTELVRIGLSATVR